VSFVDPRAPVSRTLLRLAGPAMATSLLQTAVFLVDGVMLGQYSPTALASMQIQGPIMWSAFSVFMALTVGTVALVARHTGARELADASAAARAALRIALEAGLILAVLGFMSAGLVARVMTTDATLVALSTGYMRIAFLACPVMFVASTAAMILNSTGDTRTPFRVGIVTNVVNLAVNAVCIFGIDLGVIAIPAQGVVGAAIGSAVAFTVEAVLLLKVLRARSGIGGHPPHGLEARGLDLEEWWRASAADRAMRRRLVAISMPALVERLLIHAGYLAYARVVNALGPDAMATHQALLGLEAICFLAAEGFGIAAATAVGQLLGAGRPELAQRAGWVAVGMCVTVLTACGIAVWAMSPWALAWFSDGSAHGAAIVAQGVVTVPLLAAAQPLMAVGVVLAHALRGAGDTISPVISALLGGVIVRVFGAYTLGHVLGLGIYGIWLATTLDWGLRTVVLVALFGGGAWRRLRIG
jgi:putative MATE family efflux protein